MSIIIENFRRVEKGALKAFFDVKLDSGMKILDCRVVQQDGQAAWVSEPQSEYKTQAGERKFKRVVEFQKELKEIVQAAALEAYEGMS